MGIVKKVLTFLLFFLPITWVLHSLTKNFVSDPDFSQFLVHKASDWNEAVWPVIVRVHIVLAVIALLAGLIGFVKKVRTRRLNVHRTAGKVYVAAVVLNVVLSLYLALFATGGLLGTLGFLLLNAAWLATTLQAYRTIRRKQVDEHRRWMVRSYAVSLANVTLNVLLMILSQAAGIEYVTAYLIALWVCWPFNWGVAELAIRRA